jgi:hypothetical protein
MSNSVLSTSSPGNIQTRQAIPAQLLYSLVNQKASGKLVVAPFVRRALNCHQELLTIIFFFPGSGKRMFFPFSKPARF